MKTLQKLARLVCITAFIAAPFSAANATQYITGGIGWFDFDKDHSNSTEFMGEWRGNTFFYGLLPVIGASVNTDGGVYGYGGFNYDWEFVPNWILTPSVNVGLWSRGDSAHLGGPVEFREGLELDYRINQEGYRVGVQFNHRSNADIYDNNPGAETLLATFSIPLGN